MEASNQDQLNSQTPIPVFKVDPIMVLVFGILSCGLYLIYWNIKVAEVFNAVAEKEVISQPVAIFAGCCMPVNIYFYYLAGKEALPKVYQRTGEFTYEYLRLCFANFFFRRIITVYQRGYGK